MEERKTKQGFEHHRMVPRMEPSRKNQGSRSIKKPSSKKNNYTITTSPTWSLVFNF